MEFVLRCSCGRPVRVTAAQAGSELRCDCGNVTLVPMLSELRRGAGQPAYGVDIAETLRNMHADGLLPLETRCVQCQMQTEGILKCSVECERTFSRGGGFWVTVIVGLVLSCGDIRDDYRNREVHGRELVVQTPLRLCDNCRHALGKKPRKRRVVELLRMVPMYDQLLREYPNADIMVP